MSQYRAVEEKVPTGINRVPHSWAVSSGWVDPQPVPLGGGWGVYLDLVSRQQSVFCVYLQMLDAGTFGRNSPSFWESERERSRKFNMDAIIMTHICSQEAYLLHMSNDSCFLNRASQLRMSTAEVHREYVSIFMLSHQKCFGCCFKKRALQICFNLYSV